MPLKLIEKEHLTDNVWAFRFTPTQLLEWIAGQYLSVELPHENPDGEGTKRWFTISSAPYEEVIQITTRVTDSTFKQTLSHLPIGGELQLLGGPYGNFVWQDSDRPLVFIAGGIGITPLHSILKQRVHDNQPLTVTLVYASRTPDMPFKDELQEWAKQDANLKVHYVVGTPLTAEGIYKLVPELNQSLVYLTGPQALVVPLADNLAEQGLALEHLKKDFFPAYTKNNY